MAGDRERFLEAGANDVLSKPFRLNDLTSAVDRLVGGASPA
jgi:CheY-like chemotaxis protein